MSAEKQNELWIVFHFLTPVVVKGRILSADALHIQQAFCGSTTRWQGDYVLIATDNQPTLADDLRHFFSELPADCRDWRTARALDKGHGRLEIREVMVSTELNALLVGKWTGVAQVCRLRLLFLDRWNLWYRLTRYRLWKGPKGAQLDGTNNACERVIGWWIKERYRSMRGYKVPENAMRVSRRLSWCGNCLHQGGAGLACLL